MSPSLFHSSALWLSHAAVTNTSQHGRNCAYKPAPSTGHEGSDAWAECHKLTLCSCCRGSALPSGTTALSSNASFRKSSRPHSAPSAAAPSPSSAPPPAAWRQKNPQMEANMPCILIIYQANGPGTGTGQQGECTGTAEKTSTAPLPWATDDDVQVSNLARQVRQAQTPFPANHPDCPPSSPATLSQPGTSAHMQASPPSCKHTHRPPPHLLTK